MKPRSLVLLVSRSEKWFVMPGNQFQPACQLRRRSLPFSGSSYWPCGEKATNLNVVNASPLIFHRGLTVQNDSRLGFWHGLYNMPLTPATYGFANNVIDVWWYVGLWNNFPTYYLYEMLGQHRLRAPLLTLISGKFSPSIKWYDKHTRKTYNLQ